MAKRKEIEYTVTAVIRDTSIPENTDAERYIDRIRPQLIPIEEYFADDKYCHGKTMSEWWRERNIAALKKAFPDCEVG